jgi:hypothetical protein
VGKVKHSTAFVGKKGEYAALGKIMSEHLLVFTPVTDLEGIDAVIRTSKGTYNEVQVKTRTEGGSVFDIREFKPRPNYYLVFHIGDSNDFWVVPSKEVVARAKSLTQRDRKILRVSWTRTQKEAWNRYHNAFYELSKAH